MSGAASGNGGGKGVVNVVPVVPGCVRFGASPQHPPAKDKLPDALAEVLERWQREDPSRRVRAACPVVVATALHAAQRARVPAVRTLLLAVAGLAVACLAGRRHAARGVALAVSLLVTGYALARRHYPAARARVASAAATLATATAAGLAWLVLTADATAAAVRDGSAARRVNALAGDTQERWTRAALALWDVAAQARTRLTLAGLSAALGVALAVLGAAWDAVR
jgi:hypothetical protein